ncbi:MFS transporter [Sphingobacterium sp. InxBP1]|uniref:MFS transporter n=1 Tax=Sphingobacterium sp. InxBP1 TaxID=2870328 RepID=UPI002243DCFF|nr:MFS transporter [Sphingobacterium sp. InxBP1]MCW8309771.1 MFS transporter [Sphingobacterium sp. InxBP1]
MRDRIFRDWVSPRWELFLLFILNIIFSFNNGIPSSINTYVMNGYAGISADLSMATYCYYAGMVCAIPLVFRLFKLSPKKAVLIVCIVILLFSNMILEHASNGINICMATFFVGSAKMIVTMAIIGEMIPFLMPRGERYQLYAVYYPMTMIIPALASYIAARLAGVFYWEAVFLFQNILLGIGLLICILFMQSSQFKRIPLYQYDWFGNILLCISLLNLSYFTTYGLTQNWLHSPRILITGLASIAFLVLFVNRSLLIRKSLMNFSSFASRILPISVVTIFLFGIFYSSTSLYTSLLNITLGVNPEETAAVNTYVIPGYILGTGIAYLYFRITKKCKFILAFSALCYTLSCFFFAHIVSSEAAQSLFWLPMILRGMGVITSYIGIGVYMAGNIPSRYYLSGLVFLILTRSFLVPVIWANVLANGYYRLQLIHANHLATLMDKTSVFIAGHASLGKTVQIQSSLLAIRDSYNWLFIAGLLLTFIILIFPFHSSSIRKVFDWRNRNTAKDAQQIPVS